jgi:hypothetical protein
MSDDRQYNAALRLENSRQRPIGNSSLLFLWLSLGRFLVCYEDDTYLGITVLSTGNTFQRNCLDLWNVLIYYLPEIET